MKARVISFHYTLTNAEGKKLDSSVGQTPLSYLEGAHQIIPGLEKEIKPLKVKDKKKIKVTPEEAYGLRDERFVVQVPRENLPKKDLKVGDQFQVANDPSGRPLLVTQLTDTHATLDANHPLAGVELTFDIEMIDIREATDEELAPK